MFSDKFVVNLRGFVLPIPDKDNTAASKSFEASMAVMTVIHASFFSCKIVLTPKHALLMWSSSLWANSL